MNIKGIVIVVLMLSALGSNLAFKGDAAAAQTRLQAILRTVVVPPSLPPPADALPAFAPQLSAAESLDRLFGRVRYVRNANAKRTEEELTGKVTTSVPNASLGVSEDLDDAADKTGFLLRILQGVGPIEKGNCVLLFKHMEFEYQGGSTVKEVDARFAVHVKERVTVTGMQINKKIGSCWVNGVEGSVPDIAHGDTAEIYLLTDLALPLLDAPIPVGGVVMTGSFRHGYFHDDD